tara:strand:+ start:975 stop:1664 length:690 start_codon:yes stop_codon:yes gene_type:complete
MKLLERNKEGKKIAKLFEENFVEEKSELQFSKDFICIYETKQNLGCKTIIKTANKTDEWVDSEIIGGSYSGKEMKGEVSDHRDSTQIGFEADNYPAHHLEALNFASRSLNDYLLKFPQANLFPEFRQREPYNLIKYKEGQAFHNVHSDYYPFGILSRRHLTGIVFLNDVKEGGDLYFPQQDLTVKSEKNKMIIFPSGWTHVHKTFPPINQERYVLQLWWSFDSGDSNGY